MLWLPRKMAGRIYFVLSCSGTWLENPKYVSLLVQPNVAVTGLVYVIFELYAAVTKEAIPGFKIYLGPFSRKEETRTISF